MDGLYKWLGAHETLLWWGGIVSAVTFAATLVFVPVLLARMRADHFSSNRESAEFWRNRNPALRVFGRLLKNLLGAVLVGMGVLMLVLPGQGVLTILMGVALLDVPGKRRLERRIVRQRHVRSAVNWIRARANRPPLIFQQPEDAADPSGDAPPE